MTIAELLQKKGELSEQAKQILDDPNNASRIDLRAEDQTKFDAIHVDIEKITALVQRMQKQEDIESKRAFEKKMRIAVLEREGLL